MNASLASKLDGIFASKIGGQFAPISGGQFIRFLHIKYLNYLERQTLIILDDFGLQSLNQEVKLALLQILEDRYAKRSVIITSQLPVAKWHEYINEPTLADAIMDRMTAQVHRIELTGESRRKKKNIAENNLS